MRKLTIYNRERFDRGMKIVLKIYRDMLKTAISVREKENLRAKIVSIEGSQSTLRCAQ